MHGAQGKVKSAGENAANYASPEFDRLFEEMKHMPNSAQRQEITDRALDALRRDAPWLWGYHPKDYVLYHAWYRNLKPNKIAYNTVKYQRIDSALRAERRRAWNTPLWWPFGLLIAVLAAFAAPAVVSWRRRERVTARGTTGA